MEPWDKNRKLLKNYDYWSKERGFFFLSFTGSTSPFTTRWRQASSVVSCTSLEASHCWRLLFTATALKFIHTLGKFLITGLHFLSTFSRPFPWWPRKINRTDVWSVPGYWNMAGHQSDFRKKLSINKTKQHKSQTQPCVSTDSITIHHLPSASPHLELMTPRIWNFQTCWD